MGSQGSVTDTQPIKRSEVRDVQRARQRRGSGWIRTFFIVALACLVIFGWNAYKNAQAEDAERLYRDNATAVIESRGFKVVVVDAKLHMVLLEGPKGDKKWFNIQQDGRDYFPTTACAVTDDLKVVPDTCAVNHQPSLP